MEHELAAKDNAVERYVLGEMGPEERDAFEDHYFACEVCSDDVRTLTIFVDNAKAVLGEPAPKAIPLLQPQPRSGKGWLGWFGGLSPQFAFGGLSAVCAVLLAFQTAAVSRLSAPVAATAAVLHGESRGDVPVAREGQPVSLIVALEEHPTPGTPLQIEVRSEAGNVFRTLTAEAPPQDQGLSVFLPDPKLKSGRYAVVIGSIKYPFEIR